MTGEALAPAPVRARPLLAPVDVAYVIPASSRGRRRAVGRALVGIDLYSEARALCTEMLPKSRKLLGEEDDITLGLRYSYAQALVYKPAPSLEELRLAVAVLEKLERTALRVLGPSHPKIPAVRQTLGLARGKLFTDVLPARSRRDA